jgi:hypothetical protein
MIASTSRVSSDPKHSRAERNAIESMFLARQLVHLAVFGRSEKVLRMRTISLRLGGWQPFFFTTTLPDRLAGADYEL